MTRSAPSRHASLDVITGGPVFLLDDSKPSFVTANFLNTDGDSLRQDTCL
jgi:hypothetical protein